MTVRSSASTGNDGTILSGGRSYNAYRKLMKLGYENIYQSLYYDWKQQGLPIDK